MGVLRNSKFSQRNSDDYPLIGLVLGGQVLGYIMGQFDLHPIHLGGAAGHQKLCTTFLTHSQKLKAYLLLRYSNKNQSIGVT